MISLTQSELNNVVTAILAIRAKITWKPGKAEPHLVKRMRLAHLPETSTLKTYEAIIDNVIMNQEAKVYVFVHNQFMYPTLTALVEQRLWLVMMGIDGVLETAFPPDNPQKYLSYDAFVYLGILQELLP